MTASNTSIHAALAAFQAAMPIVAKDASNSHFKSKFASLAQITRDVMPILTKNGLSFSVAPRVTPNGTYEAVGILAHTSGETITGSLPLYGQNAQQLGSALTYCRRYLLSSLTGVVTDDDDDGTLAAQNAQRASAAKDWDTILDTAASIRDKDTLLQLYYDHDVANAPKNVQDTFRDHAQSIDRLNAEQAAQAAPSE